MKVGFKLYYLALLFACTLFSKRSVAQRQGDFWAFGEHCAISFTSGEPAFIPGSNTQSDGKEIEQGASSISDSNGTMLFYTDGQTIWNSNNDVMQNGDGILGNIASTQSSLIVPQPGNCSNYYYLFTTDSYESLVNGLRYSVIDICEGAHNGAVVQDDKNVLLLDTVSEKLCAMMDNSGNYWIMAHKLFSDSFYAFYLQEGGITDTVVTQIGSYEGGKNAGAGNVKAAVGQMKFSPDGTKLGLIIGNQLPNVVEWYSFDQATGKLSNYVSDTLTVSSGVGYGLEFSPDNTKLYASDGDTLMQFNLKAGDGVPDSVQSSKKIISGAKGVHPYGMLLGPDHKIYVCMDDSALGIIESPDSIGDRANFVANAVSLEKNKCYRNLPDFVAGYHYGNKIPECNLLSVSHAVINAACAGASGSAVESVSGGTSAVTISWNTSPPQTGPNVTDLLPGTYVATISGNEPCFGPVTIYDTITVGNAEKVLAVPNAFTPGSNDGNGIFIPYVECNESFNYMFRIYNRWGQLLFETNEPNQGWDGTFNGKREPVDVYVYYIAFTCGNCSNYKKGNITLLR